jgi:type I restriction enzyme R subunit
MSLVRLIVERGAEAVKALPKSLRETEDGAAETIENNVRRLIVDETPINPKYYEKMSQLLDALIQERKKGALAYEKYLEKIVELTRQAADPAGAGGYPTSLRTRALRALYDNLGRDEALALKVDKAIQDSSQDDWRNNPQKIKRVKVAIKNALGGDEARAEQVLELAKRQNDY